jgi:hypothetical protein
METNFMLGGSLVTTTWCALGLQLEETECKLDLMGVQEVRWDRGGTQPAGEYTFFYGKENESHELGTGFIVHK